MYSSREGQYTAKYRPNHERSWLHSFLWSRRSRGVHQRTMIGMVTVVVMVGDDATSRWCRCTAQSDGECTLYVDAINLYRSAPISIDHHSWQLVATPISLNTIAINVYGSTQTINKTKPRTTWDRLHFVFVVLFRQGGRCATKSPKGRQQYYFFEGKCEVGLVNVTWTVVKNGSNFN